MRNHRMWQLSSTGGPQCNGQWTKPPSKPNKKSTYTESFRARFTPLINSIQLFHRHALAMFCVLFFPRYILLILTAHTHQEHTNATRRPMCNPSPTPPAPPALETSQPLFGWRKTQTGGNVCSLISGHLSSLLIKDWISICRVTIASNILCTNSRAQPYKKHTLTHTIMLEKVTPLQVVCVCVCSYCAHWRHRNSTVWKKGLRMAALMWSEWRGYIWCKYYSALIAPQRVPTFC